jgi:hypothetical protein
MLWITLLATPSQAGGLEVALDEKTALLHVPANLEVALELKGPAADSEATKWENTASSSLAVVCADSGAPAADDFTEQLLLKIGEDKWALAPGSTVKLGCPTGKKATATDIHGSAVAQFEGGVSLTVAKARERSER